VKRCITGSPGGIKSPKNRRAGFQDVCKVIWNFFEIAKHKQTPIIKSPEFLSKPYFSETALKVARNDFDRIQPSLYTGPMLVESK
jgi:hypothetical protein